MGIVLAVIIGLIAILAVRAIVVVVRGPRRRRTIAELVNGPQHDDEA